MNEIFGNSQCAPRGESVTERKRVLGQLGPYRCACVGNPRAHPTLARKTHGCILPLRGKPQMHLALARGVRERILHLRGGVRERILRLHEKSTAPALAPTDASCACAGSPQAHLALARRTHEEQTIIDGLAHSDASCTCAENPRLHPAHARKATNVSWLRLRGGSRV